VFGFWLSQVFWQNERFDAWPNILMVPVWRANPFYAGALKILAKAAGWVTIASGNNDFIIRLL